jgi:hypothetical protein
MSTVTEFFENEELAVLFPGVKKIAEDLYLYKKNEREYPYCRMVDAKLVGIQPLHRFFDKANISYYYTPRELNIAKVMGGDTGLKLFTLHCLNISNSSLYYWHGLKYVSAKEAPPWFQIVIHAVL